MRRQGLFWIAGWVLVAWQAGAAGGATHRDIGRLGNTRETKAQVLNSYCLDREDRILACDGRENCIRTISPDDKLVAKWPVPFEPQAIACRPDGSVVVAGAGRVALLDATGGVMAAASLPVPPLPVIKGRRISRQEIASLTRQVATVTSVAALGEEILVCASANCGYTVYRMNSRLEGGTPIIKNLRGCCGQMDMTARGETIYVAQNGLSQVVQYDRDGRVLRSFGKDKEQRDRYFNGCCEPKNLCLGADGSIFAAESDQCCVNRFSPEGRLLERVGSVKGVTSCVRVTVAVNRDASRVYLLDTSANNIHILARASATP